MSLEKSNKNIRYLHFGERCHPITIINMMLKINIKTLFQLGVYPFNAIVQILEDERFDDIMNIDYLTCKNKKLTFLEVDKIEKYCHQETLCHHTKYNGVILVHDYGAEDNVIVNYNFIQKSHKLKQKNFYEYINSGDFLCFITILFESNLESLMYEKMSQLLSEKYGVKDFVIVIFTNDTNPIPQNLPKCYEIVILKDEYRDDVHRSEEYRINLYKDMWKNLSCVLKKYGYEHASFEEQFDINRMPRLNVEDLHNESIKEQKFD
jgi:hypothetical protein